MMTNVYGASNAAPQVDSTQMNQFRSYVTMLGDPNAKDEIKLKAAQELSEHFEVITQCSGYQTFLEHSMKIFIKILQDGTPHFISEYNIQQVRDAFFCICLTANYFILNIIGSKINFGNDTSAAYNRNFATLC